MSEEKLMDFDEKNDEQKSKNQIDEVAKKYGLNLSKIEEVILPNGKEYFKFFDVEDNTIRMIENRKDGKNLSEQFKDTQERLGLSQGENDKTNARAIFDYIVKFNNIELNLISITDLRHSKDDYKEEFNGMDNNRKKELRTLLESAEQYELTHINLETMVGVSKNNEVFQAVYNSKTDTCELVSAEIRNYQTNKITGNNQSYTIEISDSEFDAIVADYDVESLENSANYSNSNTNNSIIIKNRVIDFSKVAAFYTAGTNIDSLDNFNNIDRMIYKGIIAAIVRKKQKLASMEKQRQYVLKNSDNKSEAAFIDSILLSLLLGFFSGLLMSIIILAIKTLA